MKQLLYLFFIINLMMPAISLAQKAQIIFENKEHNFGTFKEKDGVQSTIFKFKNNGDVPLVLNSVRASCGCTTPRWTREPVPPKGLGQIQVSYNPKNRPGAFNKTIFVSSNSEERTTILRIKGKVQERKKTIEELYPRTIGVLRVRNSYIPFSRIKVNEVKTRDIDLINNTEEPVDVGIRIAPKHIDATVEPKIIPAKGKGKLIVTYNAEKANTYGFVSHRIYLSIDGSKDYKNSVGVSATIEEDFSHLTEEELANAPVAVFSEKKYDFGEIKQGDKREHTFILSNKGKSELVIRNIRSSCGCTAVAPAKKVVAPGESVPVKVTFNSRGKRGRQSKSITVITSDPKNPSSVLRISCNITV